MEMLVGWRVLKPACVSGLKWQRVGPKTYLPTCTVLFYCSWIGSRFTLRQQPTINHSTKGEVRSKSLFCRSFLQMQLYMKSWSHFMWTLSLRSVFTRSKVPCPTFTSLFFSPLHPNISIHILHNVSYVFPKELSRRICFTIKSFLSYWSYPLFSRPSCAIQGWYCKEKLDASHP